MIRTEYDELLQHLSGAMSNLRGLADTIDHELPAFIDDDWTEEVQRHLADALAVVVSTTEQALEIQRRKAADEVTNA